MAARSVTGVAPVPCDCVKEAPGAAPAPASPEAERRSDAECAITRVPQGECCARLCSGRAVTAKEAQALDTRA